MAYTLEAVPLPLNVSTTLLPEKELTAWEKVQLWFTDMDNVAQYILIPVFCVIFGGCVVLYIIHKLRMVYRKNKRKRKLALRESMEKEPIIENDGNSTADRGSPYISKIVREPVILTYIDNQPDKPLNEDNLYPETNRSSLYPPKPANVSRLTPIKSGGQPAKRTVIQASKPKTQIVVRCRCSGTMHEPGCAQFSLPKPATPATKTYGGPSSMRASASDVSIALRDAMDKVSVYEHELKTNPSMQALLAKYRQIKTEKKKQSWEEHAKQGNWTKVPIAQLLERKRQMSQMKHQDSDK